MPTYTFLCDKEDNGCGAQIELTCSMNDLQSKKPTKCPTCKKRKPIRQLFDIPFLSMPKTLGSHVDKNTSKLSADEKHHLTEKHNEYKKSDGHWESTADGMKYVDKE